MAPYVPNPKSTSTTIMAVLKMDWLTIIMLFRCIFSMPVKAAVAVATRALVRMLSEDI